MRNYANFRLKVSSKRFEVKRIVKCSSWTSIETIIFDEEGDAMDRYYHLRNLYSSVPNALITMKAI